MLSTLGYHAAAYEEPLARLSTADAAHTTLILAAPSVRFDRLQDERKSLDSFLKRGGSVLATGISGALLLDQGDIRPSTRMFQSLCLTQPEGFSPLARAGSIPMAAPAVWGGKPSPDMLVAQRCGSDAVVIRWKVGVGTATWWSSARPLTNAGLHDGPSLRLLLASIAPFDDKTPRTVLFDEYFHGASALDMPDPLKGLPLPLLLAQAALVAALLVFSFSRRHGPIRKPGGNARTSPIEFAHSMGALYRRGGALRAPVDAAERRLYLALRFHAGLGRSTLDAGPQAIGRALHAQFGEAPAWEQLSATLARAEAAGTLTREDQALALVRALDEHAAALPETIRQARTARASTVHAGHKENH